MSAGAKRSRYPARSGGAPDSPTAPRPGRREINPPGSQFNPAPPAIGASLPAISGLLSYPKDPSEVPDELRS